ncbi:MAG: CBS domain-containing protein [Inhella sp.]|uniref:CBS domain-containing protein n=1 Tax=Inhella sp. TaxID=1921806 RepID=UPI0022CC68B6|nr:CBS domain-containing protein [Inhella sp.]MCZ8236577.1 CBS domain-containing protein [Inhella sp.]
MSIASIAQSSVVTIDANATVQHAAQLMRDRHIGSLVVTQGGDSSATLAGVLTDRDLALNAVASALDPKTPVREVCSTTVYALSDRGSVADAVETMRAKGVRRLLLVDDAQRLTGIVSFDDVLTAYAEQLGDLVEAIDRGAERESARERVSAAAAQADLPVLVPQPLAEALQRFMQTLPGDGARRSGAGTA